MPDKEKLLKNKTFCMIPWTHLHTWPDGRVLTCCMTHMDDSMGNLKDMTLEQAWNSTQQKQLRKDLLNGKANKLCNRCYEQERHSINTTRTWANEKLNHHWDVVESTKEDGTVDKVNLPYIDFRFSNLCNFKCRTCGPDLSSSWYEDHNKMWNGGAKNKIIRPYKDEKRFWEVVEPYIDGLEEVYFAGGEPLIMEEHYRILQRLVEKKMFHVRLKYNTNFSQVIYKGVDVFKEWDKFEYVEIGASLDATHKRGEYLRAGQNWDQVEENRKNVFEKCPRAFFFVATCVDVFNSFHVSDFHIDWIKKGWVGPHSLLNPLQIPEYLRVQILPKEMKDKLAEKWTKAQQWMIENTNADHRRYESMISYLYEADETDKIEEWLRTTDKLDKLRNENWREVFPELLDLEKYQLMLEKKKLIS
jgi:radical SAM protein with 4Fe4S-binding SPASM domain